MKDRSDTQRGACLNCDCSEYELASSGNKCEECGCTANKHRQEEYGKVFYCFF
jgi:hypothetical protein